MQTRIKQFLAPELVNIEKYSGGKSTGIHGAFPRSSIIDIKINISRKVGACGVTLRIVCDSDKSEEEMAFEFVETDRGTDTYSLRLDLKKLCKDSSCGLFYYTYILRLGDENLYISSVNNVDYVISEDEKTVKNFRLLVYDDGYTTPDWAKDAVMYHIFVDRFRKTDDKVKVKSDSVINEDWDGGTPAYQNYTGEEIDNNMFFGGTLYGVASKLEYLSSLGVNCIYLSPVFDAHSNHKYDTGDYMKIDEMFGGEDAFAYLLEKARENDIKIILDGVFNHTGDDSLYFNRYGKYNSTGAYQSRESEYYDWYTFTNFPEKYECWWGIKILPKLRGENEKVKDFFLGEGGVVAKYLRDGTSGWRLDVADELTDDFLTELRKRAKSEKSDALIIGEVWENAADKIAYGVRRQYFSGFQLDSVMNYPLKNAIIDYMKSRDCTVFYNTALEIYSSYPKDSCDVLMNILGTHDTPRILTELGTDEKESNMTNAEKSVYRLSDSKREEAVNLLKMASLIQFTIPGMPSVYYGDEAGSQGFGDPFCRMPFPWNNIDADILEHYKALGALKHTSSALTDGEIEFIAHDGAFCAYTRHNGQQKTAVLVNAGDDFRHMSFDCDCRVIFGSADVDKDNSGKVRITVGPQSGVVAEMLSVK